MVPVNRPRSAEFSDQTDGNQISNVSSVLGYVGGSTLEFQGSLQFLQSRLNGYVIGDGGTGEGTEVNSVLSNTQSGDSVVNVNVDLVNLSVQGSIVCLEFQSGLQFLQSNNNSSVVGDGRTSEQTQVGSVLSNTNSGDQIISVSVDLVDLGFLIFMNSLKCFDSTLDGQVASKSRTSEKSQVDGVLSNTRQSYQVVSVSIGLGALGREGLVSGFQILQCFLDGASVGDRSTGKGTQVDNVLSNTRKEDQVVGVSSSSSAVTLVSSCAVSSCWRAPLTVRPSVMVEPAKIPRLIEPSATPDKEIRSSTLRVAWVGWARSEICDSVIVRADSCWVTDASEIPALGITALNLAGSRLIDLVVSDSTCSDLSGSNSTVGGTAAVFLTAKVRLSRSIVGLSGAVNA